MQKMSLPEGAIRQKMTQDGLPADRQDAFFRGEFGFPSLSKAVEPSPELLQKLEKYTKMKKMNLPEGAIRQKMLSEGVSAQEIALFFGNAAAQGTVATALKKPNDEVSIFRSVCSLLLLIRIVCSLYMLHFVPPTSQDS
jgi:hypothetical protein